LNVTPARVAALDTLRTTRRGELADRALLRALEQVPPRDRPWTQELAYGTLRLRSRLDHLLAPHVRGDLARLDPDVLDVLRLGAYQLLEMTSVPVYAAVSQSVELARAAGQARAAGLVNAVLQSLRRSPDLARFPSLAADPVARLVSWGAHPRWLVERWVARFGAEAAAALVAANDLRPELYLRPVGVTVAEAVTLLASAGVEAEAVARAPDAARLVSGALGDALAVVPAIVQDPAAGLVVRFAAPPAGALVADLCAAPGGKAIGLAAGGGGARPAYVLACDVSAERIMRLADNARRVGTPGIGVVVADARRPPVAAADVVLLDAPCTGTGTLRRHPDGKWRLGPRDLEALVELQAVLLRGAVRAVRPGGLLVYATCSLEREENEDQVDGFLASHPMFTLEPGSGVDPAFLDEAGRLRVTPERSGWDGAFAARLRLAA
jgi:16S rRNA (cytosine967-C5)-methyltransferase